MSVEDDPSVVDPGWYPDPADAARLRRWDGDQWTQEVILMPDDAPASSGPSASNAPGASASSPPSATPAASPPPAAAAPPAATAPPAGRSVPASPAPGVAPPGQPTIPRPSPTINQHANPSSGPVSLPDWANLPGLTLPPDLSSIPGFESDSVLPTPTFADPAQRELPVFEAPFIPQRPDAGRGSGSKSTVATGSVKQRSGATSDDAPYAPPPQGSQYDVPPPPGMAHVPGAGPVLPPSALVAPLPPVLGWASLPPVGSAPVDLPPVGSAPMRSASIGRVTNASGPETPVDYDQMPRTTSASTTEPFGPGPLTMWAWLIGLLPLMQLAAIYAAFHELGYTLEPGMQWGILLAPSALSLLFANSDRKRLAEYNADSPGIPFAFLPPLYLFVRSIRTGRSSLGPFILWIVAQGAAAAGLYFLQPELLAVPIPPFS